MSKNKRKVQLLAAFTVLFLLAFAVGCRGFFVNPTLTGVQVGPTATIQQNKTVQESATGTYDDGTTKTLGSGVVWSIADASGTDVATITAGGLVMGTSPGTATVTGADGPLSGTATITVTLANLTTIQITPTSPPPLTSGDTQQFNAFANGTSENISTSVMWTLTGTAQGVSIDPTGLLSTTSGDTGSITVQAVDPSDSSIKSNSVTVTID